MSNGITDGNVKGLFSLQATITPTGIATITTAEQTFSLPGVKVGDSVTANAPSLVAGVAIAGSRVSANDTVAITFVNPTAGTVTPVSGAYNFLVFRPESQTPKTGISA